VLHRVYARTGLGSYGGILKKDLTAMPETWDAMMDGYQSLNHCMLGHVIEWYYGYVLGIRQQPDSVGWERVVIGPNVGELTHAEGSLMTPRGTITSGWRVEDGTFRLQVEIPQGVQATAVLPSGHVQPLGIGKQEIVERR
jgi:alpha-L-rhamnosidase